MTYCEREEEECIDIPAMLEESSLNGLYGGNFMEQHDIFIWGMGVWGKDLLLYLPKTCKVKAFVDAVPPPEDKNSCNGDRIPVISPEEWVKNYVGTGITVVAIKNHQAVHHYISSHCTSCQNVFYMYQDDPPRFYQPQRHINYTCSVDELLSPRFQSMLRSSHANEYMVFDVEDTKFFCKTDFEIMVHCFLHNGIHQQGTMHHFFELMKEHYHLDISDCSGKYFLDIGANIGTTSIYVKKRIAENMKILAFEPVKENCRQFLCSCALNDLQMGEDFVLVNAAVSSENSTGEIMLSPEGNWGDNRVVKNSNFDEKWQTEKIRTLRLDDWLEENNVKHSDIACVWMDVQAHEAFVVEGGKNLFGKNSIPMVMEVWPSELRKNDSLELLLKNLKMCYRKFVCMDDYPRDITVHDIDTLESFISASTRPFFDIFLIK